MTRSDQSLLGCDINQTSVLFRQLVNSRTPTSTSLPLWVVDRANVVQSGGAQQSEEDGKADARSGTTKPPTRLDLKPGTPRHVKVPRRIVPIEIRQGTFQISRKINCSI